MRVLPLKSSSKYREEAPLGLGDQIANDGDMAEDSLAGLVWRVVSERLKGCELALIDAAAR